MKRPSKTLDPDTTPEQKMENFNGYLGRVLKCSKTELDNALAFEKKTRNGQPRRGPKPFSSARVSRRRG
jgi:hypothetical protein